MGKGPPCEGVRAMSGSGKDEGAGRRFTDIVLPLLLIGGVVVGGAVLIDWVVSAIMSGVDASFSSIRDVVAVPPNFVSEGWITAGYFFYAAVVVALYTWLITELPKPAFSRSDRAQTIGIGIVLAIVPLVILAVPSKKLGSYEYVECGSWLAPNRSVETTDVCTAAYANDWGWALLIAIASVVAPFLTIVWLEWAEKRKGKKPEAGASAPDGEDDAT